MRIHELFENQYFADLPKPAELGKDEMVVDFLTNEPFATVDQYAEECAAWIVIHCGEWLQQVPVSYGQVYRGIETDTPAVFFTQAVRKDRRPRDSGKILHELLHKAISKAGLVANRHNSAFVSASRRTASMYGMPYVAMPVGKFNYTWSEKFKDAYTDKTRMIIGSHADNVDLHGWQARENPVIQTDREKFVDYVSKQYRGDDGSIKAAIQSKHEIMIACEHMLYIDNTFFETYIIG